MTVTESFTDWPSGEPLLAYHGSPTRKAFFVASMEEHRRLDRFIAGQYVAPSGREVWRYGAASQWRGCAVGCTVATAIGWEQTERAFYDLFVHLADYYPRVLGYPVDLAELHDVLFERLAEEARHNHEEIDRAADFAVDFLEAAKPGADLSGVATSYYRCLANQPSMEMRIHGLLTLIKEAPMGVPA